MADFLTMPVEPGVLRDRELSLEPAGFGLHPVHKVLTYYFQMVHVSTREELGSINLRVGSSPHIERYAGHVGYGVHENHRGHRYAARAVRLLLPLAGELGLDPLWITCDPENAASRRTLELAGAECIEEVAVPADCVIFQNGKTRKCRYRIQTCLRQAAWNCERMD